MSNFAFGQKVFKSRLLLLCQNASAGGQGVYTIKYALANKRKLKHSNWSLQLHYVTKINQKKTGYRQCPYSYRQIGVSRRYLCQWLRRQSC